MKKYLFILVFTLILLPNATFGQNFDSSGSAKLDYGGLVQCDGVVNPDEPERNKECDFQALMYTINYVIKWVFGLTIPIFIGLLAYGGLLYMSPKPASRETANKMLWAGVKGFAIMLIAWFAVSTVLKWVVNPDFKGTDAFIEK